MGYNAGHRQSGWETSAMDQVPTDSVLKRHHAQQRQVGGRPADSAPAAGGASSAAGASAADSASSGGGLCGWLKKLFCR